MASVSICCATRPAYSIKLGFHQNLSFRAHSSAINLRHLPLNHRSTSIFRLKNAARLLIGRRLPVVHASNNPSEEPIGNPKAITSSDTSTAQGPPFLTILAGIVVFAFILWVIGSIVSWLIGLLGLIFSK